MKNFILFIFILCSFAAFGQTPAKNAVVRATAPTSGIIGDAIDGTLAYTASGTNTYAITTPAAYQPYGGSLTYADGDIFKIVTTNANTATTVSLIVDGEGVAQAVKDNEGNDLAIGDFVAGGTYILRHNGTHFRVINLSGGGGTVTSVSGTADRIDVVTGTTTPVINISATFETLLAKIANRIDQNNSATTSAQLATVISDETGTGSVVYSASPALTGTPTVPTATAYTNSTVVASTAYTDRKADALLTFKTESASHTLDADDLSDAAVGKVIYLLMDVATANNVTIPTNATLAFPLGTVIYVVWQGVGQPSFVASGGVTINSASGFVKIQHQYSAAMITKTATNTWLLIGTLAP